jgi:RimJ/RimL family protein N-acetyltransferase
VIRTDRLRLIPARAEHFQAMREGDDALGRLLGVQVADSWVGLDDHRESIARGDEYLAEHPGAADWWTYLFVYEPDAVLVGVGGLKGEPDRGVAEIGYALAPAYRGQGLAAEAARGLMEFAFARPEVTAVQAHTLPEESASTAVLRRLGMTFREAVEDPDDGPVWRWSLERPFSSTAA